MERHVKDFLNDPFRFLVDDEGVFLFRVALVTERRVGKYPLTVCKLGVQRGFDLAAGIFRKPLIEQVLEGNEVAQPSFRVLVLGDGDVTYLLLREHKLEVVIHHNVLAPEAA